MPDANSSFTSITQVIQERKTAFAEEKKRGLNKGESIDDGTFISSKTVNFKTFLLNTIL